MFEEYRNLSNNNSPKDEFDELIESIKNEEIKLEKKEKFDKCIVEISLSIFTVVNGKVKLLLIKKMEEPYKGYWTLPTKLLNEKDNIDNCILKILENTIKINNNLVIQSQTYSNIISNYSDNTILISYIGFTDYSIFKNKRISDDLEYEWFNIEDIPKMAYEYNKIVKANIEKLKELISKIEIIKNLFSNEFSLHELQMVYESILDVVIDRRNFRKKIIKMNLIDETGEYNDKTNGRPSKLYRFKDNLNKIDLF